MKQQTGFTLIELMLSIAIYAVISLAGFTIFNTVAESEKGAREKITRLNQLQTTFIVLERDITQIARRHVRGESSDSDADFIYESKGGFSTSASGLSFVRSGWSNPGLVLPRSQLQTVSYQLADNKFERTHYNFVDPVLGEEPKVRVLLTDVTDLSFEFFYDSKWSKELTSGRLPTGIAIELETADLGMIRRQFLVAGDLPKKVTGS
ncbi:MAG: type II secretion system minor pseudopilin GspJ [Thalassotalea sp.]